MAKPRKNTSASRPKNTTNTFLLVLSFGIAIFLHPVFIELSEQFLSPVQEMVLLGASLLITGVLFLVWKSHLICSLVQSGGLLANAAYYILLHASAHNGVSLWKMMDYEWCFRIILMWCGGVSVTILIRLFAHKKWNASHIRKSFGKGFLCSSIVFFILYVILLLDLFIFQRSTFSGERSLNLIPLKGAFAVYWPHIKAGHFTNGIFVQFFGNLLIFVPLGFYLTILWRKKKHRWFLYLMPFLLAATIEGCQYIFNIGKSDVDDLWMNVVGFYLGIVLCRLMDAIRKKITKGKEKTIFVV